MMDASQLRFMLEELNFSAAMPVELLEALAAASTLRHLEAGTVLFREGSTSRDFYLIHEGCVALEMSVPGRGSIRILTVGPGEMVGWSSLLDEGRMMASAVVVEETQAVVASAEQLLALCETSPALGYHLMRRMAVALSRRLMATRLQLLDLFADTPAAVPVRKGDASA
jgi:CRP-like cAMP-binding protein